jgi:hypothetical protein
VGDGEGKHPRAGNKVLSASGAIRDWRRTVCAFLCVAPFICGCHSAMPLPREPITVPFSVAEKGFSITTDFAAVKRKYRYLFSLDLVLEKNNEEQFQRLAKLWGGPSSFNRETSEFKPVGTPIPLRLTVSRVVGEKEEIVFDNEFSQLASWAGSRTQLSKLITYIKLTPGHYRVHLVALEAVPELAATKVNLRILVERK